MFPIALKQKTEKQIFNLLPLNVAEPARPGNAKTEQQIADSDTVSTYQVSSVQLVTNKKLEAFCGSSIWSHKCDGLSYALLIASSFLLVTNCTEVT